MKRLFQATVIIVLSLIGLNALADQMDQSITKISHATSRDVGGGNGRCRTGG